MTGDDALVLDDIHRRFGATAALAGASLRVRRGTVHALLGENGAGKTTLMRIAFGLLAPDRGEVRVDGTARRFRSSADAIAAGLGMVHQHFMLVPALTVAENVALGGRGRFSLDRTARMLRALADRVGLPVDPTARVADLSVGEQQRVEILKALAHDARLLILDEPTAVLPPELSTQLLAWVRRYVEAGGTVVLITHKLREALAYSDDVTVLRRGQTVLRSVVSAANEAALVEAITGGEVGALDPSRGTRGPEHSSGSAVPGRAVLAVASVSVVDARGITRLREASLEVRAGEVLGVIGVEGSGHRELLRLLAGRLEPASGTVTRPRRVGFVPEDRLADALVPEFSLTENLALAHAGHAHGVIDWAATAERTTALLAAADVRAPGTAAAARTLSGGNQQKFVVARERAGARDALVAEHPTRGLDLQASARVLDELRQAASRDGLAVVVHSPDLDEVLSVATRVVACFGGRVREVPWPTDRDDRSPFARALVGAD